MRVDSKGLAWSYRRFWRKSLNFREKKRLCSYWITGERLPYQGKKSSSKSNARYRWLIDGVVREKAFFEWHSNVTTWLIKKPWKISFAGNVQLLHEDGYSLSMPLRSKTWHSQPSAQLNPSCLYQLSPKTDT